MAGLGVFVLWGPLAIEEALCVAAVGYRLFVWLWRKLVGDLVDLTSWQGT